MRNRFWLRKVILNTCHCHQCHNYVFDFKYIHPSTIIQNEVEGYTIMAGKFGGGFILMVWRSREKMAN